MKWRVGGRAPGRISFTDGTRKESVKRGGGCKVGGDCFRAVADTKNQEVDESSEALFHFAAVSNAPTALQRRTQQAVCRARRLVRSTAPRLPSSPPAVILW